MCVCAFNILRSCRPVFNIRRWSELALATLAVPGVRHALSHEADELTGLQQSLRLRSAADTLAVDEHARYLQHATVPARPFVDVSDPRAVGLKTEDHRRTNRRPPQDAENNNRCVVF